MRFELTIQIGNDAMQTYDDIAEALQRVARDLEADIHAVVADGEASPIWDNNGNRVGAFGIQP